MQSKRYVPKRGIKRHGISAQEEEKSFPAGASQEGLPRGGRIFYGPRGVCPNSRNRNSCQQRDSISHMNKCLLC